jgi:hypothetical protein
VSKELNLLGTSQCADEPRAPRLVEVKPSAPACHEEDRQAAGCVASGLLTQPVALVLAPPCRIWDVAPAAFLEHRWKRVAQPDGLQVTAEVVKVAADKILDRCDLDAGPIHEP